MLRRLMFAAGCLMVWGMHSTYTEGASASGPSIEIVWPKIDSPWTGGTHHILWHADPAFFGTAARVELWDGSNFLFVLGYKWDCGTDNDLEVAHPRVETRNTYRVHIVSIWIEMHPELGQPSAAFSNTFTIVSEPLTRILFPPPSSTWNPEPDGTYKIQYTSAPELLGTAVRIDLYSGSSHILTMGYNWNNQANNTIFLPYVQVPTRSYNVRVTSIWLEQNPSVFVRTYVENSLVFVPLVPKFFLTLAQTEQQPDSPLSYLRVGWRTDRNVFGSAYRVELKARQSGQVFLVGNAYSDAAEQTHGFWIPPIQSSETAYRVLVTSYWQEMHPSVGRTTIQSETVYVPHPGGIVIE